MNALPYKFAEQVKYAIDLIANNSIPQSDEELMQQLTSAKVNEADATDIILFLPIAFIRAWLPTVQWLPIFVEEINGKDVQQRFDSIPNFQIIQQVTQEYFSQSPEREVILRVSARSAEFHVINDALNDNPGTQLSELTPSPTIIYR